MSAHKIVAGLRQTVQSVNCEHAMEWLRPQTTAAAPRFQRYHCAKCGTVMWIPTEPVSPIGTE